MSITNNNKYERAANAMTQAMVWLDDRGIDYQHLPPYQLKIDEINFWPGRGTITIDGVSQKCPEKGLDGLEKILVAAGKITENERQSRRNVSFRPKLVR